MGREALALAVFVAAVLTSAALVPLSRALATRLGVIDHPGSRKVHDRPMPRLGGIAVFLAFATVVATGFLMIPYLPVLLADQVWLKDVVGLQEAYRVQGKLLGVILGSSLAFGVGLMDDWFQGRFPVLAKAAGQILAASILVGSGVRTSIAPWEPLNILLTLLWVVGMTNAFNFLDNMDGLCAGVAFVASGVFLMNAWLLGEFFICLILAAFMGSLLGFLMYNFSPATVFLGDCGSLFIGFTMASLTLLERYVSHASSTLFPVLMPVLVLAVPLVDTVTVVFLRLRAGRPVYVGDNRHLSHRLVALGFSKRAAVLLLYLVTFCLGAGAASLADATPGQALLVLLQSLGFVGVMLALMFVERQRERRAPEAA